MPDILHISSWSYTRQFLNKQGNDAMQVLKDIVGVYSWHPSASLSLLARIKTLTEKDFQSLDTKKNVLRIPAMRLSVHMQATEIAPLVFAATIPAADDPCWEKRYGAGDKIPSTKYQQWRKELLATCKKPFTVSELKQSVSIPEEAIKFLLNRMCFEGDMLRVGSASLRSNILSYITTDAWAKKSFVKEDPDKALQWLASAYMQAFGPIRIKDFQWWAGVSAGRAKTAIAAHDTTDIGDKYLLLTNDLSAFEKHQLSKIDTIDILPQWDTYTMGYAPDGRQRFVSPDMQQHIYGALGATGGNGLGTILINGTAHASWDSHMESNKMNVSSNIFEKITAKSEKQITQQFESIASLLQAKSLEVNKKKI